MSLRFNIIFFLHFNEHDLNYFIMISPRYILVQPCNKVTQHVVKSRPLVSRVCLFIQWNCWCLL